MKPVTAGVFLFPPQEMVTFGRQTVKQLAGMMDGRGKKEPLSLQALRFLKTRISWIASRKFSGRDWPVFVRRFRQMCPGGM